jgi:(+)-neomenthol dehydrogenase
MTTMMLPAYSISKMVINLYTRIMARRLGIRRCASTVCDLALSRWDMNWNLGVLTPEQGARGPVMRVLLPDDGQTG